MAVDDNTAVDRDSNRKRKQEKMDRKRKRGPHPEASQARPKVANSETIITLEKSDDINKDNTFMATDLFNSSSTLLAPSPVRTLPPSNPFSMPSSGSQESLSNVGRISIVPQKSGFSTRPPSTPP